MSATDDMTDKHGLPPQPVYGYAPSAAAPRNDIPAPQDRECYLPTGLRKRPEDQDLPVQNDEVDCQTRLMNRINVEIPKRRAVGIQRYGTALQPFNGRNALRDLWEEIADAATYFMQVEAEYDALVQALADVIVTQDLDELDEACARGVRLLKSIGREIPHDPFIA